MTASICRGMRNYKWDFVCSENVRGGPLFCREAHDGIPDG